jgi:hypothetical protein
MSSATKKFALAALSAPVLAALAIGLAGPAVAAPAGPPSDVDAGVEFSWDYPILSVEMIPAHGAIVIRFKAKAARPAGRTTRGAATHAASAATPRPCPPPAK